MRTRNLFTCLSTLLILVCLVAGLATAGYFYLTIQAEHLYGPANARLGVLDRLLLSGQLILSADRLSQPANPSGAEQEFTIALGEGASMIARRLQDAGLILDAGSFVNYLVYAGLDTSLQAGAYRLNPALSAIEIAQELQDATPDHVTLTLLAGWRLEEVAQAMQPAGLAFDAAAFLAEAAHPPLDSPLSPFFPPGATLEGFMLPGMYEVPRQASAPEVISLILERASLTFTPELQASFQAQGLDLYQAITLASIIEREAVVDDEMPLIAGVFLNRLRIGMPLQSDPTAQYALGYNPQQATWWTNPLSLQDLQIASPYNTYQVSGLPPGPIASPGSLALQAVAFPEQTEFLYFRAACDGSGQHRFARSFEEHQQNACP